MLNLSKRARLALYVLVELARSKGEQRSSEELANTLDVSVNHLAKVMQTLAKAGWVVGARGAKGGYRLVADAKSLAMADVVELFEGAPRFDQCGLADHGDCRRSAACEMQKVVCEIEEQVYYTLKSITVYLLAFPVRGRGGAARVA